MKIFINEDGKAKKILLPTGFILNLLIKKVIYAKANGEEAKITKKILKDVGKCLKAYKKEYGSFTLVEVCEKDKDTVKIVV